MQEKEIQLLLDINEKLYTRNPQETTLGRKIFHASIQMISVLGFEHITFKKLAQEIGSTEASIYRYFDNKHKLLIYLMSWYWNWLSYRLTIETHRVEDPRKKLDIAIDIFCHTIDPIPQARTSVDVSALYQIVINESPKAYLTKEVNEDNKEGSFLDYKRFCRRLASYIKEFSPSYPYPTALISTAVEAAHHQKYFSEHLPSLTEVSGGSKEEIARFLKLMIFTVIDGCEK